LSDQTCHFMQSQLPYCKWWLTKL